MLLSFWLLTSKKKKDLISLLFIFYLSFLTVLVTDESIVYYEANFTPFKEIMRYNVTSIYFFKNVIGNIILFIPMGMYLTYKLNIKKIYIIIILSIYFSLSIEIFQLFIDRVFDVDDIILNVIGAFIGYLIVKKVTKNNL